MFLFKISIMGGLGCGQDSVYLAEPSLAAKKKYYRIRYPV